MTSQRLFKPDFLKLKNPPEQCFETRFKVNSVKIKKTEETWKLGGRNTQTAGRNCLNVRLEKGYNSK